MVLRVGVIDDHPVFRQGLVAAVEGAEDMRLGLAASSMEDPAVAALRSACDVVILDLGLPGLSGAEAVARVCGEHVKVLVVSAAAGRHEVVGAIGAGAAGYVTKAAEPAEILAAVRVIAAGQMYVSPTLASFLLSAEKESAGLRLSPRESEVLALVAEGERDVDIAARLHIAVNTVQSHLERIRDKTGLRRRIELAEHARKLGIGTEPR